MQLGNLADICVPGPICELQGDATSVIDTNTKKGELLHSLVNEKYQNRGFVMVKNTGLVKGKDMKAVVKLISSSTVRYEGGANPRDAVPEENVYDTGAPLSASLLYHHEMAYLQETVENLGYFSAHNEYFS